MTMANTWLLSIAKKCKLKDLQQAIATGAQVYARHSKGRTLLHIVAYSYEANERALADPATELEMDPRAVDYKGNKKQPVPS